MIKRVLKPLFDPTVLKEIVYSITAIVLALVIGAVIIWVSGYNVLKAYSSLFMGSFGNIYNISQTLLKSIPLVFTGLTVAVGFRSGLFNIGGEGQLYLGAFFSAIVALWLTDATPSVIAIPICIIAGAVGGAIWAFIPGYLKAKTGAHEVVTTIMTNYIGILLTRFLLVKYFKEPGAVDQTATIPATSQLPEIFEGTRLTWAIFVAVLVVFLVDYFYRKTYWGYEFRAVGENKFASAYVGIKTPRVIILTMCLSGAMAGIGGATMVMGLLNRFIVNFSPGYGFVGIAVALLGRNNAWGVLGAAILFGALDAGGMSMQLFAKIPSDLMVIIQGLVIIFVSASSILAYFWRKKLGSQNGNA